MTALDEIATGRAGGRTSALDRFRQLGSVLALVLAPWGFVIVNSIYTWATRNGGNDATGADAIALAASAPGPFRMLIVAGVLGCLLLVPAVQTAMGLARSSWLTFVGGSLMIAGYICYSGVLLTNTAIIAMAEHGGPVADFAAVIDASQADASTSWVFLLFILGNLGGTVLFAIGLLRSRSVPAWAALMIMAWPPLHVTGLVVGNEIFEVAGAILQAVGFAAIAGVVLRGRPAVVDRRPSA
jgi:hypothetical protein